MRAHAPRSKPKTENAHAARETTGAERSVTSGMNVGGVEAHALAPLQRMADGAPQLQSQAALQALSDGSPRVAALAKAGEDAQPARGPELRPLADPATARVQRVADPTNLANLASTLTPANAEAWAANTEQCWRILTRLFDANWFKAKDCLLMDKWPGNYKAASHAAATKLMDGLTNMRGVKTGMIEKIVLQEIQKEVKKESQTEHGLMDPLRGIEDVLPAEAAIDNKPTLNDAGEQMAPGKQVEFKSPVGSQKRTSDIDTATGGLNTELAVALFNKRFKEVLDVPFESGTVFDYNVYSMDWIHNLVSIKDKVRVGGVGPEHEVTRRMTPGTEHALTEEGDKREREAYLEKASLLHIRRYTSKEEWADYSKDRVARAGGRAADVRALLLEVNTQYEEFEARIADRMIDVELSIDDALESHESAWGEHEEHFRSAAVRTSASNRIYEERLRLVKQLRARHAALLKGPQTAETRRLLVSLAKETSKALSEALYFANEVYASEGGTVHAVIAMQTAGKKNDAQAATGIKVDVPLTASQWLQAFNENVGDVLKDLDHFKDDPPFAVYRAGKYMDRLCKTAVKVMPEAADLPEFEHLSALAAQAIEVKNGPAGDDPILSKAAFDDWMDDDVADLRTDVIGFGAEVSSAKPPLPVPRAPDPARVAAAAEGPQADVESTREPAQMGRAREATKKVTELVEAPVPKVAWT